MLNSSNGWAQGDMVPCSAMNIKITIEKTSDCRAMLKRSQTEDPGAAHRWSD